MTKNVLGGILQTCCTDPLTGFYRDGKCNTGPEDVGKHHVCVTVNDAFLRHQASIGTDLITPRPQWGFPGLKPGDSWCVCVEMWKQTHDAGIRAPGLSASPRTNARSRKSLKWPPPRRHGVVWAVDGIGPAVAQVP